MKSIPHYDCDFYSDAFIQMPHYHYTKMRQLGPVVYIPQLNNFAITKFKALKKALFDFESLCSGDGIAADEVGCKYVKGQIVSSDPPVHKVIRKAILPPLMPKNINEISPIVKKESIKLINKLIKQKEFDAVSDLAQFLPLNIVRDLVGVPDFGKDNMLNWAGASFDVIGVQNQRGKRGVEEIIKLRKFITGKLNLKTVKQNSWIGRILQLIKDGLLEENLGNRLIRDYINPSLDTTISAISHLILLLSENYNEWSKLQKNSSLIKNTINEAIRLGSPIRSFSRKAIKNIDIEGYHIPKNSRVMMLFASANRDEEIFKNSHKFDIERSFNEHLGFGYGIHSCVGKYLAQLEMSSLLEAMIPSIKKIETKKPETLLNNTICGFQRLPTKFIPFDTKKI